MSKFYPYPPDYKHNTSLRSSRRAGNVVVIVLCGLIALLLGVGAFFALTNEAKGWKAFTEYLSRKCHVCGTNESPAPETDSRISEAEQATPQPEQNTQPPVNTPNPTAVPAQETPKSTPKTNSTPKPSATPFVPFDTDIESHLAQPFDPATLTEIPDVVDAVFPGVVGVLNYQIPKGRKTLEPVLAGTGSGFIYTDNGYIITNQHVVESAASLKVSLHSGEIVDAVLVGADIMTDVAVLKIDVPGLQPLPIGDSAKARVGEYVLAIGDPISTNELSGSVTFGIVSALSRQINIEGFEHEYMQTDAAINPGNSGGPLINMRGEVIGVTSAKYTSAGVDEYGQTISSEGIGFALPINNVMEIVHSMIQAGSTVRPGIGVTIVTYEESEITHAGVYIYSVSEGGPAEAGGLQVGDRLLKLDGVEYDQEGFVNAIREKKVGDTIVFTVERGEETLEISVVVGDMNEIHR